MQVAGSSDDLSKEELLAVLREVGEHALESFEQSPTPLSDKVKASRVNNAVKARAQSLIEKYLESANSQTFSNHDLSNMLMIHYTLYVVMLEYRNLVWPYEYMSFSRRIGELWEPFCKLPFQYPTTQLDSDEAPVFSHVQKQIVESFGGYVDALELDSSQKSTLRSEYGRVWDFVASGPVNLSLDLHFRQDDVHYAVDYKSGFSSNEKGNTNRLLLVASIYRQMPTEYKTLMFVRQSESMNNNYLRKLRASGLWEIYFAREVYDKTEEFTGFDLGGWMQTNMNWKDDVSPKFREHLRQSDLEKYLTW